MFSLYTISGLVEAKHVFFFFRKIKLSFNQNLVSNDKRDNLVWALFYPYHYFFQIEGSSGDEVSHLFL